MEFKYILSRKRPFSRFMHSLCKMRTFLCGESTLPHNKRNCFPPYPDHYLIVAISRAWYNGSYIMTAKPIKSSKRWKCIIQ